MKKILILDDDPDIAYVVKTILEMYEFQSEYIISHKELEHKIRSYSPDLIILDIALDGVDGRELCKTIKERKPGCNVPIILFSANRDASLTYKIYHADAFISKPFDSDKLINTVGSFLNAA